MVIENPLALSYIFADDVYLLKQEKAALNIPLPQTEQPAQAAMVQTPVIAFNYTGAYQKKFLVLVHYPDDEVMDQIHLSALQNTIKRKDLNLDDIAILNINKHDGITFEMISEFFKPQKMLLLGKNALPAGLAAPALNELVKLAGCDALYSFSFAEMMGNKENTKAFWEQVKIL